MAYTHNLPYTCIKIKIGVGNSNNAFMVMFSTNQMRHAIIAFNNSALQFTPGIFVHSDTNSTSLGRIQPRCNYYLKTTHSHFQPYISLCRWLHWGAVERMKVPKLRNSGKGDSNPSCRNRESYIILLIYRAQSMKMFNSQRQRGEQLLDIVN